MTKKLNKTWLDWVLNNKEFYFTLTEDQMKLAGEVRVLHVHELKLCRDRHQAIRHAKDDSSGIFVISTNQLNLKGFIKPGAPKGMKGMTLDKWIERWYRASSVEYTGEIHMYERSEPVDDVPLVDVDLSKAYTSLEGGWDGLLAIVIPASGVLGRDLHLKTWAQEVSFGFGPSHLFYKCDIADGVDGVLEALHSDKFFKLLCDIAHNYKVKGAVFTGELDEDLIAKMLESFHVYKLKN